MGLIIGVDARGTPAVSLLPGQSLQVIAPFGPAPLFTVMSNLRFRYRAAQRADGAWEVNFIPSAIEGASCGLAPGSARGANLWPDPVERQELTPLPRPITPDGIRGIIRNRLELAGYPPDFASPHGLRSGFLTQAARDGAPLAAAMQLSLHRSASQAQSYYADVEIAQNPATDLLGD